MRFVYLKDGPLGLTLETGESHHLRVLRMGDRLSIPGLWQNRLYELELIWDVFSKEYLIACISEPEILNKASGASVWFPLIDWPRFELGLEKAVELQAQVIQFYYSDHCALHGKQIEKFSLKQEKWQNLVRAAAKQSGNFQPPEIRLPKRLDTLLDTAPPGQYFTVHASNASKQLPDFSRPLLIGPEGDFSLRELTLLNKKGWSGIRVDGQTVLRSETFLISLLSLHWWKQG